MDKFLQPFLRMVLFCDREGDGLEATEHPCSLFELAWFWDSTSIKYAINASLVGTPFEALLWDDPNKTIVTIGSLTFLSMVLLTKLTDNVCEELRWSKASRHKGISFLSFFLALGRSTSLCGLFVLGISKASGDQSHRSIAFQRYEKAQRCC